MNTLTQSLLLILAGLLLPLGLKAQETPPPPPVPVEEKEQILVNRNNQPAQPANGMGAFYEEISKAIKYPDAAQKAGIEGRVILRFTVEKDGSLSDIEVLRSPDPSFNTEAIRVLKNSPKWIPAKHWETGKAVTSQLTMPIYFKLPSYAKEIFLVAEEMPEPIGGKEALYAYIQKNLKYPEDAQKAGLSGKVYLQFVVERDGSLSNFHALKSPHESMSEEAIRVLKSYPQGWKAGKQRGINVRVKMVMPFKFEASAAITKTESDTFPHLIIVDEVRYETPNREMYTQVMQSIKPEEIASIDVLKGESAADLYGEMGKDGVIVIHLKKPETNNDALNEPEVLSIYPNPAENLTNFSLNLPQEAQVRIEAILGNQSYVIANRRMPAGERSFKWSTEGLKKGVYLIKVQVEQDVFFRRLLVR